MTEPKPVCDQDLKETVGDSFNIYQATIAMLSIFLGFVFAALLQLLSGADPLTLATHSAVIALVCADLSLLGALLLFHFTANQVVRYFQIFFPKSRARTFGSLLVIAGMVSMQLATVWLLWGKGMRITGWLLCLVTVGLFVFNYFLGRLHRDAPYVRDVGSPTRGLTRA